KVSPAAAGFEGAWGWRNASPDRIGIRMKQAVAAQRRRPTRTRELRKADEEVDFFCMASGRYGVLLVAARGMGVNVLYVNHECTLMGTNENNPMSLTN